MRVDGLIESLNPGDLSDKVGTFAYSRDSVDDAVGAAREASRAWAMRRIDERLVHVRALADRVEESADDLAVLVARETGRPLWEAYSELALTPRALRRLAADAPAVLAPSERNGGRAISHARPHGVVGLITPWTQPILAPALYAAAALLSGNTVVVKPSSAAPGAGQLVAELVDRCRLPRGVFNLVQGPGDQVGSHLAAHAGLDALMLIGSEEVAAGVLQAARGVRVLPTFVQAANKAAALVFDDADLDAAAYDLVVGAFASAGQHHDSTGRLYVSRARFDALAARIVDLSRALRVGYGFDDDVFMGPLRSADQRARFLAGLESLRARGGTSIVAGSVLETPGRNGFYVTPDVTWLDMPDAHDGWRPGPGLCLCGVHALDDALDALSRLPSRSTLAVFSRDVAAATAIASTLPFGAVHINRSTLGTSFRLPWVARGAAANGWGGAVDALRFLAPPQVVLQDTRGSAAQLSIPGLGGMPIDDDADEPTVAD